MQELKFTFHNPNTEDETAKYISKLVAETAVSKVIRVQEVEYNKHKACLV